MECPICNEEIGAANAGRFGPEFAHNTCIVAFKQGQIDGQETEREACAKVCESLCESAERESGAEAAGWLDKAAELMRSNGGIQGSARSDDPAGM